MEEYKRGFRGVDGKPLSYVVRDDFIPPVAASDTTHHTNGSKFFTHDEEMIACGLILIGTEVFGSDHEAVGHSPTCSLHTEH